MARPRKSQPIAPPKTRAAIYARVSTKEQEESGFSLDAQLAYLRGYCDSKGFEIALEFVEVETARRAGRTSFAQMVAAVRAGQIGAIVVEKTDRLYRNLKDRVTIDELGVELHLAKENVVLSKRSRSHEKFVHDIKLVVAKNYIDNLSEETRKGMVEKARQGYWPSFAPLGYVNVSRGSQRLIEPDPQLAPAIKALFDAYATGDHSMRNAGAVAAAVGLRTRSGKRVQTSSLHLILRNPLYIGAVHWNGEVFRGVHPPLVDHQTFAKVQAILDGRKSKAGTGQHFAYKGLLTCARCGCAISPYIAKGKWIYYACSGHRGCKRIGVREEVLTRTFAGALEGLAIRPERMEELRAALIAASTDQKESHETRLADLRVRKGKIESLLEESYLDKLEGRTSLGVYERARAKLESDLREVDAAIAGSERANRSTWKDSVAMLELVSNSALRFLYANSELRREMAKNLFSNCVLDGREVRYQLRSWFDLVFEANALDARNGARKGDMENWLPVLEALQMGIAA